MSAISQFADLEIIKASQYPTPQPGVLSLGVAEQLTERRVYAYMEVKGPNGTTDQWIVGAEIKCYNNGVADAVFPLAFGNINSSTLNKSLPSLFNAGGSAVGDSLAIRIANPFDTTNGPFIAVIQPFRFNGKVDRIDLNILSASGASITGFRAYLACVSTEY